MSPSFTAPSVNLAVSTMGGMPSRAGVRAPTLPPSRPSPTAARDAPVGGRYATSCDAAWPARDLQIHSACPAVFGSYAPDRGGERPPPVAEPLGVPGALAALSKWIISRLLVNCGGLTKNVRLVDLLCPIVWFNVLD